MAFAACGLALPAGAAGASVPPGSGQTDAAPPAGCDPLDERHCLLPFPSNHFTVADDSTATGRRVAFPADAMPVNSSGVAIDASEWNRNDGFSPNTSILVHVPDLDPLASALPSWTDLDSSLTDDASIVLLDVDSGERVRLWAELDSRAESGLAADRLLIIHPAEVLTEGHTYEVSLPHLVDTEGAPIDPIAWEFTVASTESLTSRMLHVRDETLAALGDAAPPFTIGRVENDPTRDDGSPREGLARRIYGTFTVTNWLTGDGSPGQRFHYGDVDVTTEPDALPVANGTVEVTFQCNVPSAAIDHDGPARLLLYGHGLLGSEDQIDARHEVELANLAGAVECATKWAGMSVDDIPNAIAALEDFSTFPTMTDRLQQGVLNQLVLTRLMLADDGLAAHEAFQRPDGTRLLGDSGHPRSVAYNGNSQGAIMGLMLAGVSTDIERFVLGVAGMNYGGLLLHRSVDFDTYEQILAPAYPDVLERTLIITMAQMLWDRGEGAGYVSHVTADPLPDTPAKDVLVHVAFGDWQVTELSAFIEAEAMGMPVHRPVAAPGRSQEVEPGWGLDTLEYPSDGSGLIVWDSQSDPIPLGNTPPRTSRDPHQDPRHSPAAQLQIAAFLYDGTLVDVCGGAPCTAPIHD